MELNILASKSPRRRDLLNKIGFNFSVVKSDFRENIKTDIPPNALAETIARGKALKVARTHENHIIIGADTIVYADGKVFGKPRTEGECFKMLKRLSGKSHEVITGVSLVSFYKNIDHSFNQRTIVKLNKISDKEILNYLENNSCLDKAGGYGIQGRFSVFVEKIDGCYFNVVGFPISKFCKHYKKIINSFEKK